MPGNGGYSLVWAVVVTPPLEERLGVSIAFCPDEVPSPDAVPSPCGAKLAESIWSVFSESHGIHRTSGLLLDFLVTLHLAIIQ